MKWLVVGAGLSGIEAALLLRQRQETVVVADNSPPAQERRKTLDDNGISLIVGETGSGFLHREGFEGVVLSPGVPMTHPLVREALDGGLPIRSEIDVALDGYQGKIIGITGTNGKSTTVSMIHHALQVAGIQSSLCGNIGIPVSRLAREGKLERILVMELSSYQLEQSAPIPVDFVGFTSFSPDHLARHGTWQEYLRAKWRIFENLQAGSQICTEVHAIEAAEKVGLSLPACPCENISASSPRVLELRNELENLVGLHNLVNARITLSACESVAGIPPSECVGYLRSFASLPHRLEVIGRDKTRRYINDSKATNVESTLTALRAIGPGEFGEGKKVVLLIGGEGKGESFEPIAEMCDSIERVIAFGASRKAIAEGLSGRLEVTEHDSLAAALDALAKVIRSTSGDVLFSPACASFDEFTNFEERGEFFRVWATGFLNSEMVK